MTIKIGAEKNEKILVYFSEEGEELGNLVVQKSLPHLIPAGKWGSFWLQMLKGALRLGYQKRNDPFFEWSADDSSQIFEPSFMSYQSLEGNVIGVYFPNKQCHTENTTTFRHTRVFPLTMWKTPGDKDYSNFTVWLRGTGVAIIPLLDFPGSHFLLIFDRYLNFNKSSSFQTFLSIVFIIIGENRNISSTLLVTARPPKRRTVMFHTHKLSVNQSIY